MVKKINHLPELLRAKTNQVLSFGRKHKSQIVILGVLVVLSCFLDSKWLLWPLILASKRVVKAVEDLVRGIENA